MAGAIVDVALSGLQDRDGVSQRADNGISDARRGKSLPVQDQQEGLDTRVVWGYRLHRCRQSQRAWARSISVVSRGW
jgi:hypothetical protein